MESHEWLGWWRDEIGAFPAMPSCRLQPAREKAQKEQSTLQCHPAALCDPGKIFAAKEHSAATCKDSEDGEWNSREKSQGNECQGNNPENAFSHSPDYHSPDFAVDNVLNRVVGQKFLAKMSECDGVQCKERRVQRLMWLFLCGLCVLLWQIPLCLRLAAFHRRAYALDSPIQSPITSNRAQSGLIASNRA
jgi:hypothetical protein